MEAKDAYWSNSHRHRGRVVKAADTGHLGSTRSTALVSDPDSVPVIDSPSNRGRDFDSATLPINRHSRSPGCVSTACMKSSRFSRPGCSYFSRLSNNCRHTCPFLTENLNRDVKDAVLLLSPPNTH